MKGTTMVDDLVLVPVALPDGWTGGLFVEVVPAITREWHDRERGSVSGDFPALRVTTYTDPWRDISAGVKWRGRTYHVDEAYYLGAGASFHYTGGYVRSLRGAAGAELGYNSTMRSRLNHLCDTAIAAFVAADPGWETRSHRAALVAKVRDAERKALAARAEAGVRATTLAQLQAQLAAFGQDA
jgi:hypothetical protein